MALSVMEPNANSPKLNLPFVEKNYMPTLRESIQDLLKEEKPPNLSHFFNIFYELMQSKIDPPLETIWVYSALSFRSLKITNNDVPNRLLLVKQLFQLVSGCSSPCSVLKSVALLAPVVFELHKLVVELFGNELSGKRGKKVVKEVKSLIGVIMGYISSCYSKVLSEEKDSNLIVSVADLVSVWMDGDDEGLDLFLPLVSAEMCEEISLLGCGVNYLAGIVVAEMFLVKLCIDLRVGCRGVDLEKELRSWLVGSITGLRSFHFFETLMRMLLEPTLAVNSLLNSEDEMFLRTILYDAAILVEYSFLHPERAVYVSPEHVRGLAMKRLILAHKAIEFFRENGNQATAVSYSSSFSNSRLPGQIIKWVSSHVGMKEEASRLNGSSPKALIRWLLIHEGEVIRVFGDSISRWLNKLGLGVSNSNEQPESQPGGKIAVVDLLPFIGEEEDIDEDDGKMNVSMNAAFLDAVHTMRSTKSGGIKRKGERSAGKKKRIKSIKHKKTDDSDSDGERSSSVSDIDSGSDSEVDNPISDDDD